MSSIMRKIFFLFTLVLGLALNAAEVPKQFKIQFQQKYKSKISNNVKSSDGFLIYSYPKKIRIEVSKPDQIIFVSNGKKSWYYRAPFIEGEPGEVVVNQGGDNLNLLASFFDILQRGFADNEHFRTVKNGTKLELLFTAKFSHQMKMKSAELTFSDSTYDLMKLKMMKLNYLEAESGNFEIQSIQSATTDLKTFDFTIPPNTKVSE